MPDPTDVMTGSIVMLDLAAQRSAIGPLMDRRIAAVLDHGKFISGPEVQELEATLAERAGVKHVVSCGNGTDALQLVLMAWGIGPGDAVFVPSFTFTATAEVVSLLGATPIFCDVREDTYNLDVESLEAAVRAVISEGSLVPKAVIPVDLFGLPADYPMIQQVADRFGLKVLADAAQSFGASLDGRAVGSLAEATATSFFPAKPLGCYGDGGAVFTDDEDLAAALRSLRIHGQGTNKYDNIRVGTNSRLDTLQASVLLAKLTVFSREREMRQRGATRYLDALAGLMVGLPPHSNSSAWAQFTIRVPSSHRDRLSQLLQARDVPTAVYYPRALHEQPAYRGATFGPTPMVSERLASSVLSLPMHPYLSDDALGYVAAEVRQALEVVTRPDADA